MASGTTRYKYKTDKGNIFYARTDNAPELASIRGTAPTGAITENITFKDSKHSKEVGLKPRNCILTLQQPAQAQSGANCILPPGRTTKSVVVLDPSTNPPTGTVIAIGGRNWVVGSVVGEQSR